MKIACVSSLLTKKNMQQSYGKISAFLLLVPTVMQCTQFLSFSNKGLLQSDVAFPSTLFVFKPACRKVPKPVHLATLIPFLLLLSQYLFRSFESTGRANTDLSEPFTFRFWLMACQLQTYSLLFHFRRPHEE